MHHTPIPPKNPEQLCEMLQSPVIELNCKGPALNLATILDTLNNSKHCCIIVKTDISNIKIGKIRTLYNATVLLNKIQKRLHQEDPELSTSLIGIYPSISRPSCVYELHSNAGTYVKNNILPPSDSGLKGTIKCITDKILGVNPSVGGLGLIIQKEKF